MATETYKPSSDVSVSLSSTGANHHSQVADSNNSTYVQPGSLPGNGLDRFGVSPVGSGVPSGATITSVILYADANIIEDYDAYVSFFVYVGSTQYGVMSSHGASYGVPLSSDITESRSWVPEDFATVNLECAASVMDGTDTAQVSKLWLEVTYTAGGSAIPRRSDITMYNGSVAVL